MTTFTGPASERITYPDSKRIPERRSLGCYQVGDIHIHAEEMCPESHGCERRETVPGRTVMVSSPYGQQGIILILSTYCTAQRGRTAEIRLAIHCSLKPVLSPFIAV